MLKIQSNQGMIKQAGLRRGLPVAFPMNLLRPVAAVQSAVLDGFGKMGHGQVLSAFEVRNCASNFEDAVVSPRGEALLLHGPLQEPLGIGAELAMGANLARCHLRVGVDFFTGLFEASPLVLAGGHHAVANLR